MWLQDTAGGNTNDIVYMYSIYMDNTTLMIQQLDLALSSFPLVDICIVEQRGSLHTDPSAFSDQIRDKCIVDTLLVAKSELTTFIRVS